ncbi:pentatricopeptide repeat-containing protein At1g06270-like [Salvia splendens]|uniref:pentatricopeptide repeat-containing protein At1g06270-like n=1 Tax=Salvia splendens TaxID=180675 RepID=UPI001C25A27E|nr:pentatricopeptide repeat-containing protein At1g06270-like [Salvia splendens]
MPQNRFRGTLISPQTCRLPTPGVLPLLTVKSLSRLLSLSLDPSIDPPRPRRRTGTLRYGCLPAVVPPPPLKSWLRQHRKASSSLIFSEMKSIRYTPDCGTCNYLFPTLSKIGQFGEAVDVLKGMGRAGCVPDCDSYGGLIAELSEARKVDAVAGW